MAKATALKWLEFKRWVFNPNANGLRTPWTKPGFIKNYSFEAAVELQMEMDMTFF